MTKRKEESIAERVRETIDEARAALWRQREKVERLLAEIDKSLAGIDEAAGVLGIGRSRQMIDRIVPHLERTGRAIKREDLIQAMVDAGAGAGRRDGAVQIGKSIDYHTIDKRNRAPRLKILRGKIGLTEWSDEKFQEKP